RIPTKAILKPPRLTSRAAHIPNHLKHADVVVPQVPRVVIRLAQFDVFFGEDVLKGAQVQRLAVRQDAVEVEDDGSKWHLKFEVGSTLLLTSYFRLLTFSSFRRRESEP